MADELKIRIPVELDMSGLQSQLSRLNTSNTLPTIKVNVQANAQSLTNTLRNVQSTLPPIKINIDSKPIEDLRNELTGLQMSDQAINNVVQDLNNLNIKIKNIQSSYQQLGENGQQGLAALRITGLDEWDRLVTYVKRFNVESQQLEFVSANVSQNFTVSSKETLDFLSRIEQKIQSINSGALMQSNPLKEGSEYYEAYNERLTIVAQRINEIRSANEYLSDENKREINEMVHSLGLYAKELQKLEYPPMISSVDISTQVQRSVSELNVLEQKWKNQGLLTDEFKTKVSNLRDTLNNVGDTEGLKKYRAALQQTINDVNLLNERNKETSGLIKQANQAEILENRIKNLTNRIIAFQNENQRAMASQKTDSLGKTFADRTAEYIAQLDKMRTTSDLTSKEAVADLQKIASGFSALSSEVKSLGLMGNTVFGNLLANIKKFANWMGITYFTASLAREVRSLFTDVVELDTALIDLKKTFKGTESDLKSFYFAANEVAKEMGATTKEIINQAAAWSRLGYSTKEAAVEMSRLAAMFAAISPDMDIDTATNGLLSIMKAYGYEVGDVLDGIMSKINVVGNEFGTSNNEIIEMLTRSSSAMKEANNTLEESIALETAAVEITRDAQGVGICCADHTVMCA